MASPRWLHAVVVRGARGAGQDRAAVAPVGDELIVALADGAGGTGGGDVAAQAIVDAAVAAAPARPTWATLLDELDGDPRLGGGQATAVLLTFGDAGLAGASVGDSGAWIVDGDRVVDLTAHQQRKPLVGSGALPVAFMHGPVGDATLLVASDGLWKYAPHAALARAARAPGLDDAARALLDLVRLPDGGLQDDVAIVLVRRGLHEDRR